LSGQRFFLPVDVFEQTEIRFPGPISRQINSVLRLKTGESVTILDNRGNCRSVELLEIDSRQVVGRPGDIQPAGGEPAIELTLCPALTQREKFEWILQKGCELGVYQFLPMITSRTLVQESRDWDEKMIRWQKILQEAAEQCGRGLIPRIMPPGKFENCLHLIRDQRGYILHEKEQDVSLMNSLSFLFSAKETRLSLLIGPEGGFSEDEVFLARQSGLVPVSLGKRVLRMETAAVAACTICMAVAGELGEYFVPDGMAGK
jgi:16S rRNA (uracil1498-N3)-methyltransferase